MPEIIKARETMTAKERVKRTFAFEKTDRVTIGYESNPVIHEKLCSAMGVRNNDLLALYSKLGVDYIGCWAPYTGKPVYDEIPERVRNGENGAVMRYVANQFGGYYDYCDFPLKDAEDDVIAAYPFPDPDNYDYDAVEQNVSKLVDLGYAIHIGNAGICDIINTTGMLMGMEDALVNIYLEDEATMRMIDRRLNCQIEIAGRILERLKGKIDFFWMGEDLGSQRGPMISLDTYNQVLRPRHQKFIDLAKAYDMPVIMHSCGSSSWVFEDLIQMGMNGMDTLQPEAANMSPEYLAERFGGRLNLRGCISTAGPLATGSVQEVTEVCRQTLQTLMPCRGYHFAPTHAIQDNTPVENIIAMYQAAHRFGCY